MLARRTGFHLFNIFRFQVSADWSWLIIAALISYSLATGYYPASYFMTPTILYWVMGMLSAALLFFSVVLHEVGHSYVARQNGIRILGIRLFIFGGVAQLDRDPDSPEIELKIALAGPAVSALLAFLFYQMSQFPMDVVGVPFILMTHFLTNVNIAMALFNMIPGFPLDGGRILRAILWKVKSDYFRATKIATRVGRIVAICFIVFGAGDAFIGNTGNGLWLVFIGLFLYQAAKSNDVRTVVEEA